MDKLQSIKVFLEVAKRQSFSEAADALGMSAPATTRAIAALEHDLKVKLFNRTTRLVRLTQSGARFENDAKRVIEALTEAEAAAQGVYSQPNGVLTVTAPVLFGQKHVMPIIKEYLDLYPQVSVKAMFFDHLGSLLEDELDVAIRIGRLNDSSLFATQVGEVRRVACGSPDYFEKRGIPNVPSDLINHDIVLPANFESKFTWDFWNDGTKETIKLKARLHCNQNAAAIDAAKDGFGVTRLMSYQIGDELDRGNLQAILTDFEGDSLPVSIVHVERRRSNAKIRAFIDLAEKRLRANPFIKAQHLNPKF